MLKRSLVMFSAIALIIMLTVVVTAEYYTYAYVNSLSKQFIQTNNQELAHALRGSIESFVTKHRATLKNLSNNKQLQAVLAKGRDQDWKNIKAQLLDKLSGATDLFIVPADRTLPAGLPKSLSRVLNQKNPPSVFAAKEKASGKYFYQLQKIINTKTKKLSGYLLVTWPRKLLKSYLPSTLASSQVEIIQKTGSPKKPLFIAKTATMKQQRSVSSDSPIKGSAWHLRVHSAGNNTHLLSVDSPIVISFLSIVASIFAGTIGLYFLIMSNVGKDIGALRQILRDLKKGELKDNYKFRLQEFRGAASTFQRLTKEIAEEQGLILPVGRDNLTKLPNRDMLERSVEKLIVKMNEENHKFAILLIEVDSYQEISQKYGYAAREAVIAKVSVDIRQALRKNDFVARSDEHRFCAVFSGADIEVAKKLDYRLRQFISRKVTLADGTKCRFGWSGGITIACERDKNIDDLILRAEEAITRTRSEGGSNTTRSSLPDVIT